ncbi:MAG: GUN4 domain-containing protein [Cyanobacteriota bacterium]
MGSFWRFHLLHSLETTLEQQQWQEADKITAQLMLKAANQTIALTPEDLAHFLCELLSEIDRRWQIVTVQGGIQTLQAIRLDDFGIENAGF